MKRYFITIALILTYFETVYGLLSNTPTSKFNLTGLNNARKIVMDGSGTKFAVWNNNSEIQMYTTSGTRLCSGSFTQQIQRIIWPTQYNPILLPFPGTQFMKLNQSTCQPIKTYNIKTLLNMTEEISQMNFIWKNNVPALTISGIISVYQIDLNSASMTNAYTTLDATGPRYQTSLYSADGKYIYVVMTDAASGTRSVKIFETRSLPGKLIKQIPFNTSITGMTQSRDNQSIICFGGAIYNNTTSVYKFDNNGNVRTAATKPNIIKSVGFGDGNVAALFKTGFSTLELIRISDGQSIQNIDYLSNTYVYDADYKNKVLVILDSMRRIFTVSYEPDDDVEPIPDPVKPGSNSIWIIIVAAVGGVIVLTIILMYVFREKLPQNIRKKLPKCFNTEKQDGKQPLLKEDQSKQNKGNNQPNPKKQDIVSGQIINPNPNPNPNPKPNPNLNGPVINNPNYQVPRKDPPNQQNPSLYRVSSVDQVRAQRRDGLQGKSDAQIMQILKRQEQRLRQQQLEKRRHQQQLQRYKRQQQEKRFRQQQQERYRRQQQYRRQKEWQEQQRLMEIERRRREQYEKLQRERIRRQETERLRREDEARRYYEYQKMQQERKRIQQENKRIQQIRRIQYQRYLQQQQQRRRYPPYPSSSNNINIPPKPYSQNYIPPKQYPNSQDEQKRVDFVSERNMLIKGNQEKPSQLAQQNDQQRPVNQSFFVVKRKEENPDVFDNNKDFNE